MDNRYIGVFDSGLGGLTAVKELMETLPNEGIVYFGDTGRIPYGTRSNETIIKYVLNDIRFLLNFNIKVIVIACGTASAVALEVVKDDFNTEIIGVVDSAVLRAVEVTKNGNIGIIGTQGTINSGKYQRELLLKAPNIKTYSQACPLFVPLVENGHFNTEVAHLVAKEYLEPLKQNNVDTIIMGCTHYPLLRQVIYDIMGDGVNLVDPGAQTAEYLKNLLTQRDMLSEKVHEDQYKFFVSDSVESFARLGGTFLEREINGKVEKVDIEKY